MNILSLFDGISCGRVALDRAGIPVNKYYASEIDKYAIQISQKNYPDIIRLGDINNWENWDIDAWYHKGCDGKRSMFSMNGVCRMATPVECERLQTLPDGFTEGVSDTQRYKCLGNGWTVDVIAHILKSMTNPPNLFNSR